MYGVPLLVSTYRYYPAVMMVMVKWIWQWFARRPTIVVRNTSYQQLSIFDSMTSPTSTTQPELDLNAPIYDKAFAERAFWKVFNEKSTKLFSDWPAVWRTSDDYKEEQAAIKRVAKPFFFGGITSIVIFANFRLMANPSFQRMLGRRHVRTLPKNKAKTKPSEQHQSRERNVREQREEFKSSLTLERDKKKRSWFGRKSISCPVYPLTFSWARLSGCLSLPFYLLAEQTWTETVMPSRQRRYCRESLW